MWESIVPVLVSGFLNIAAIAISRVISHFEHKRTEKSIAKIHVALNGERQELLKELARQRPR